MTTKKVDYNDPKPPTQEQFNAEHAEPRDYGEDGDQLLGHQYTREQALEIFCKHWEMLSGEKPSFTISDVVEAGAGWTPEPDQYEDGDYCFVWTRGSDIKVRYEAWALLV